MDEMDLILEEIIEEESDCDCMEGELIVARGICFSCGGIITQEIDIFQEADDCISFDPSFCVFCDEYIESKLPKDNN
jgi:hypothetical protein